MRPGPDLRHPYDPDRGDTVIRDGGRGEATVPLSMEQRSLIAALQTQEHGMTLRQLEARLSWPRGGIEATLDALVERRMVARLNTVVPSYVYRFGVLDPDIE